MTRRRYVQIDGVLVEVSPDYEAPAREHKRVVGDRHYDGLRAPDGARTDISTRAKHREYMKRHDLTTVDDFKGTWDQAAKARANIQRGIDPARRRDVERAIHQLSQKRC